MKNKVSFKERIVALVISVLISLMMKDAISVFATAFLPEKTVSIRIAPCQDGNVRGLTIPFEDHNNELFQLFQNKILDEGEENALNGWTYTEGKVGISWTRVQASEEGAEITITARDYPESYFTVFSDMWSGAFEMTVEGYPSVYIDCYQDRTDTELVYIKPFENNRGFLFFCIILHILATGIIYIVIRETLANTRNQGMANSPQFELKLKNIRKEPMYPFLLAISIIVFFSMVYLFVNQARGFFRSDLLSHIKAGISTGRSSSISYKTLAIPYFLGGNVGCGVYLALLVFVTMLLIGVYLRGLLKLNADEHQIDWSSAFLIGITVCFTGGIYIPNVFPVFYLHYSYDGPGSAASFCTQPWQNSSYILMRLMAVITMLEFWKIRSKILYSKIKPLEWISFTLLLFITTAVKPNFIMAFAPALLVMLIFDTIKQKGRNILQTAIFGSSVLVSIPVMLYQKGILFKVSSDYEMKEGTNSVEISHGIGLTTSIFEKMINNKVLLPMLFSGLLFFVLVTIMCVVTGEVKEHLCFSWLMLGISLILAWFFIEGGTYAAAGNFGWGVPFCALMLMISCIERIIVLKSKVNKTIMLFVITPMVLMIVSGVCYYVHLLGGGDFVV